MSVWTPLSKLGRFSKLPCIVPNLDGRFFLMLWVVQGSLTCPWHSCTFKNFIRISGLSMSSGDDSSSVTTIPTLVTILSIGSRGIIFAKAYTHSTATRTSAEKWRLEWYLIGGSMHAIYTNCRWHNVVYRAFASPSFPGFVRKCSPLSRAQFKSTRPKMSAFIARP
jgi:hypothetical protein